MTDETRIEVTENAIRWCGNILAEVLSNHGGVIPSKSRLAMKRAVEALAEAGHEIRFGEESSESPQKDS